jgi:crotonobetainyl-CoA:carnitine CoA-transferase CaiB-like acyl-CoA transferase
VIKSEPVGAGDDTRAWLPKEKDQSAIFLAVNHNKRSIAVELKSPEGPLGKEPGYDVMLQAFSGMLSSMGDPDGSFSRASFSPVDLGTGSFALSGILAALLERQQTGKGVYVEVSLLDTSISQMGYMAQNYWRTGSPPRRMGTAHPAMSPYQAFETADGDLMLGVGNDAQRKGFVSWAK